VEKGRERRRGLGKERAGKAIQVRGRGGKDLPAHLILLLISCILERDDGREEPAHPLPNIIFVLDDPHAPPVPVPVQPPAPVYTILLIPHLVLALIQQRQRSLVARTVFFDAAPHLRQARVFPVGAPVDGGARLPIRCETSYACNFF